MPEVAKPDALPPWRNGGLSRGRKRWFDQRRGQREALRQESSIPNLESRIDDLLQLRYRALSLPPDIASLYLQATGKNARITVRRWSVVVAAINVCCCTADLWLIPHALIITDICGRLAVSLIALLAASFFQHRPLCNWQQAVLIIPCPMMVVYSGTIGWLAGSPALTERFLYYAVFATLTAAILFPIRIGYTIRMAGLVLLLSILVIVPSAIHPAAAKCQIIFVYATALAAVVYTRHVQSLYQTRLFLMNTREELRASTASRLNEQLSTLAYTDKLTGLQNRRYFDEICASMSDTTKKLFPLSLCMMDIDHFKILNDHLGHLRGDHCLRLVAHAMKETVRGKRDIVVRYGGEEFVIVLPDTNAAQAREIVERVRAAIEALAYPNPGAPAGTVTASFGLATIEAPPLSIQGLIAQADSALYRAKQAGRNRVFA